MRVERGPFTPPDMAFGRRASTESMAVILGALQSEIPTAANFRPLENPMVVYVPRDKLPSIEHGQWLPEQLGSHPASSSDVAFDLPVSLYDLWPETPKKGGGRYARIIARVNDRPTLDYPQGFVIIGEKHLTANITGIQDSPRMIQEGRVPRHRMIVGTIAKSRIEEVKQACSAIRRGGLAGAVILEPVGLVEE